MKIRVLKSFVCGRLSGKAGDVVEVRRYEGLGLVKAGIAEEITDAEADAGENAQIQQENPAMAIKKKTGRK